ncbi:MAG: N-acyl homoserine lactonase family protein [Acidobacteriia bacterium]|nr:N-acyl homoserine lactonase family protein [Terriglobia bacterium]
MTHRNNLSRSRALLLMALLAITAVVISTLAQQHWAQAPRSVRLYVFDCGVIKGLDPALFNFKKEEVATTDFAVPCYLVVHPKGTLMWDVGVIPDATFKADGAPVTQGVSTATRRLDKQLAEIGYAPSDITYLAHSHYHLDHIANSNEFASSTWLVRQVERDAMFAEKPPALVDPSLYSALKTSKTVIISTDEYDVFGDGKVVIKFAPGHTPGHQVLILKLAKTGTVMLAGDLYHYPEERGLNRVPTFEFNKEQSLASRAMIEAYVKKTGMQLWIEHDFAANAKLKKAPKYYD